jgi:shikimate dehydrogenase
MDKYAVLGNPIKHSLSPQIHCEFAAQCGIKIDYQKILVDDFNLTANKLIKQGLKGFNITVPFKIDAFNFATKLSTNAKLSGAVNTIKISKNEIFGDNTDGVGLKNDLTHNLDLNLKDKIILIIGAGGASRGIIPELLKLKPRRLMIANRTAQKALDLADEFAHLGKTCGFGLEKIKNTPVDLMINATSVALGGKIPNIADSCIRGGYFYDLSYGKDTDFMLWAKQNGAKMVFDGWGMLVEQAKVAFQIWYPETNPDTTKLITNRIN